MSLSILNSINPERVCKQFWKSGTTLKKKAVASVCEGVANTATVETAADLVAVLQTVTESNDLCIVPGRWRNDQGAPFRVIPEDRLAYLIGVSKDELDGSVIEHSGERIAARLKRGIEPSHWMLLDCDSPEGMPEHWQCLGIKERLELLDQLIPGLSKCERVELRSSSSRVVNGTGAGPRSHAWVKVSHPDLIESLREFAKVATVNAGLSFDTPRRSRETGEVIGLESRTLVDLSVLVTGRIVFCARPELGFGMEGYTVVDAGLQIVNAGAGELGISWVKLPDTKDLNSYEKATGRKLSYSGNGGTLQVIEHNQLTLDTEIERRGIVRPLRNWLSGMTLGEKLRCESPFRVSQSEAAFIRLGDGGRVFVFDVGTSTKYTLERADDFEIIDRDTGEIVLAPSLPRSYEEILDEASSIDGETPPAEIQRIAVECKALDPIERRMVFSILKKGTGIPLGTLTDAMKTGSDGEEEPDHLQLATEVIRSVGAENIFEAQSFVWLWDGSGAWRKNEDRAVKQLVQKAIPDHTAEVYKSLVDGVTDVLKNEVHRSAHEFNVGPVETVNCPNGEVSLGTTWELHPHTREHYSTTQIPVSYDPTAKAPRFEQFLSEVFDGDIDADDKRTAVLQMMGYTLMAHCRHEKFVVLLGGGANGKSVLLSVLEALVGPKNVCGVQPHQFDNVFQRGHLHCKLANIVSEIRQGEVINDAALKGIVSGELTTVEHKNRDPFEMRPFATCWFGTNHMPHTRDDTDGFFRRALVLSFNNVFKPELGNADPHLKDKLMEELPGILNMALEAYDLAINITGFITPASSSRANDEWRLETDQVAQFFDEECERRAGSRIAIGSVYAAYQAWARESGIRNEFSSKRFSQRMERLGVSKERTKSERCFTGIYCHRAVKLGFQPFGLAGDRW